MAKIVTDSDIGTGLEIVAGKLKTNITKSDLGLGNVNNTSDVDKPVSTATANAIATSVNGLIEDSIADGITTKAPSQNAVFDALATKENTITFGTTSQYYRGDKTWQDFPSINTEPLEFNLTNRTVWNNGKGNLPSNTSFGEYALPQVTTGGNNTGLGRSALNSVTEGYNNVGIGSLVLDHIITGSNNIGIGVAVGFSMSGDNSRNIGIGTSALGSTFRTGNDNIGLGNLAGAYSSIGEYNGNSSIYIGNSTQPLGTDQTNQIVIGHEAIGAGSNTVTLGNTSIVKTILRGNVGIGTTNPLGILDVSSTTSGSLPFPRMTQQNRIDISSPPTGMHVYQTDGVEGVYVKKSTGWIFAY